MLKTFRHLQPPLPWSQEFMVALSTRGRVCGKCLTFAPNLREECRHLLGTRIDATRATICELSDIEDIRDTFQHLSQLHSLELL